MRPVYGAGECGARFVIDKWNCPVLEPLLRELQRNPALLKPHGFEVLSHQSPPVVEVRSDPWIGRLRRSIQHTPICTTAPNE